MANFRITANGTVLPEGVVSFKKNNELLWSEGTGRSATSGAMVGSIVAQKVTFSVQWGVITSAARNAIKNATNNSFFPVTVEIAGAVETYTMYRGSISGNLLQTMGNQAYWNDVTLELVQR